MQQYKEIIPLIFFSLGKIGEPGYIPGPPGQPGAQGIPGTPGESVFDKLSITYIWGNSFLIAPAVYLKGVKVSQHLEK